MYPWCIEMPSLALSYSGEGGGAFKVHQLYLIYWQSAWLVKACLELKRVVQVDCMVDWNDHFLAACSAATYVNCCPSAGAGAPEGAGAAEGGDCLTTRIGAAAAVAMCAAMEGTANLSSIRVNSDQDEQARPATSALQACMSQMAGGSWILDRGS